MALEFITIGEVPKFVKTVLLRPEDERNLQSFTSAIPPTDFEEENDAGPGIHHPMNSMSCALYKTFRASYPFP